MYRPLARTFVTDDHGIWLVDRGPELSIPASLRLSCNDPPDQVLTRRGPNNRVVIWYLVISNKAVKATIDSEPDRSV